METEFKLRNPTVDQINNVIAAFETVLPMAEELERRNRYSVSMIQPSIDHSCGTAMCHGGWYAVAKSQKDWHSYIDGAELMATDMGYNNSFELCAWAACNHTLWGNRFGGDMFAGKESFNDATRLQQIVDHWKSVRDRIAALPVEPESEPTI